MKTTFLHKHIGLIIFILLGLQMVSAQSGITSFSAESIIPTIPPIEEPDPAESFLESNTVLLTIRDTISIGDGVMPITEAFQYTEDSLIVENGDSITFTLTYTDIIGEVEVYIYYDFNNDGLQTIEELVYQNATIGPLTDGFMFPYDDMYFNPKNFYVVLMQNGVEVSSMIGFSIAPPSNPTLVVKTSSDIDYDTKRYCIPVGSPIIFCIENQTTNDLDLEEVKLANHDPGIANINSYRHDEVGLPEVFTAGMTSCPDVWGRIDHNMPPGTNGEIACRFRKPPVGGSSSDVRMLFTIGCCASEDRIYSNTDPVINPLPIYTNVDGFIETDNNIVVDPQQNVIFKAGNYIRLKPGFHGENNSFFHGLIEPCYEEEP